MCAPSRPPLLAVHNRQNPPTVLLTLSDIVYAYCRSSVSSISVSRGANSGQDMGDGEGAEGFTSGRSKLKSVVNQSLKFLQVSLALARERGFLFLRQIVAFAREVSTKLFRISRD